MSDPFQEAAEALARSGHDQQAISARLQEQFPGRGEFEYRFMAMGGLAALRRDPDIKAEPEPEPEPVLGAPLGPAPLPGATRPTRNKYRWLPAKHIALGAEARQTRTLIAADIGAMAFLFNGTTNGRHEVSWGTVTVKGQLTKFDLRVYIALSEEIQASGAQCTSATVNGCSTECYAAETSFRKIHGRMNSGAYGGSACRRIKESLDRMIATTIQIEDTRNKTNYSLRVIQSYETLVAPSGKRLLVRLGHDLTTRIHNRGGIKGTKPVELEAWRQLRGNSTIAYLMADHICNLHDNGTFTIEELSRRLNLGGSAPKRLHQIKKIAETLNGLKCCADREDKKTPRILRATVQDGKLKFRAEAAPPAQQAA